MSLNVSEVLLTTVSKDTRPVVTIDESTLNVSEALLSIVSKDITPAVLIGESTLNISEALLSSVSKDVRPILTIDQSTLLISETLFTTVHRERAFYEEVESSVSGIVCIDDQPIQSRVIAFSIPEGEKIGETQTNSDGSYTIDTSPYDGFCIITRFQDYGETFQANTAYSVDEIVHPTNPIGFIFRVTTAGTTGSEPDWTEGTVLSGGVTFESQILYPPASAGYVRVDVQ